MLPELLSPAPGGDRPRLRAALPDLRALGVEQPRRRAAPGGGPRAEHLLRRGLRRVPRPARAGRASSRPSPPTRRSPSSTTRSATLGLKAVVMSGVVPRTRSTRRHGRRVGRHARPRQSPRLRPAVGEVRGARRRAHVPRHRLRVGQPGVAEELRLQPPRQLRRRAGGGVPLAGHGRRAHALPELRLSFLEGGVAWAAQLYADLLGPLREAQPRRGAEVRPGALRRRRGRRAVRRVRRRPAPRLPGSGRRGRQAVGRRRRRRATASTTSPSRGSPAPTTSSTSSPASSTSAARPTTR